MNNTMPLLEQPTTQVPPYFWTHELSHKYGGNGFYFLEYLGRSESGHCWVRLTDKSLQQVRTARMDLLAKWEVREVDFETKKHWTRDFPIRLGLIQDLKQLREDLASGRKVIANDFYLQSPPKK